MLLPNSINNNSKSNSGSNNITNKNIDTNNDLNGYQHHQQRKTRHDQLRRANAIRARSKSSVG